MKKYTLLLSLGLLFGGGSVQADLDQLAQALVLLDTGLVSSGSGSLSPSPIPVFPQPPKGPKPDQKPVIKPGGPRSGGNSTVSGGKQAYSLTVDSSKLSGEMKKIFDRAKKLENNIQQSNAGKASDLNRFEAKQIGNAFIFQNKADIRANVKYSQDEKEAFKQLKDFLKKLDASIDLDVKEAAVGEDKLAARGCEKSDKWLSDNNFANKKFYEAKTKKARDEFSGLIKDFGKTTKYPIKLQNPKKQFTDLKRSVSKNTGRLNLDNPGDLEKLSSILDAYAKSLKTINYSKLSQEQKNELQGDLYLMVVLNPSMLKNVVDLYESFGFDQQARYDLMAGLYELNIGYIEDLLSRWTRGSLTRSDKDDLDFAKGYYAALLPYRSEAEKKSKEGDAEAAQFVKNINGLSDYLKAILCKKQALLEASGADYIISARMLDDESKRDWHVANAEAYGRPSYINARWDRCKTYKKGSVSGFTDCDGKTIDVEVDENGRPVVAEEDEWVEVDKNKVYYRHFYVDLDEISFAIDEYEKSAKKKNRFESDQQLRIAFIEDAITKFYDYLKSVEGKGVQLTGGCEACLKIDLLALRRQGQEPFSIFNGYWKNDIEGMKKISEQNDANLQKAKNFFESINKNGKYDGVINKIKYIQSYKAPLEHSDFISVW